MLRLERITIACALAALVAASARADEPKLDVPKLSVGGGLTTFSDLHTGDTHVGGVGSLELKVPGEGLIESGTLKGQIGGASLPDGKRPTLIGNVDLSAAIKTPVQGLTVTGGVGLDANPNQIYGDLVRTGVSYRKGPAKVNLDLIALGIDVNRITGEQGYYSGARASASVDFNKIFSLEGSVMAAMTYDKYRAAMYGDDPAPAAGQNGTGVLVRAALTGKFNLGDLGHPGQNYWIGLSGMYDKEKYNLGSTAQAYDNFTAMLSFGGTF